jgi:hypothetical protein
MGECLLVARKFFVNISEQSTTSPHSGERQLRQAVVGRPAAKEKLSLPAIVAGKFGKLEIGLRARLLGRLLASVGPLALKVVGGGVFAKYVRHARSPEIPVSFEDAACATSSEVCDLVHYVEQSNPTLVEGISAALSLDDATIESTRTSISHCDRTPLETQEPCRRIESKDLTAGHRFRGRDLHDY